MSLNSTEKVQGNPDLEVILKDISSSFNFSPQLTSHSKTEPSVSDSAYNSMVCSPFSPPCASKSQSATSPTNEDHFPIVHEGISPYLEFNDTDNEVFQVSMGNMNNATFRPISLGEEPNRLHSLSDDIQSPIKYRSNFRRQSLTSQRSISTQTKFSMGSSMVYRPNSAPLYEGLEEELDDINREGEASVHYGFHRNYTIDCIRSPMPDLIQPTIHNNNLRLGNRLSLIADQFDERYNNRTSRARNNGRTRRFSTSSIADMAPGGSFLDLLYSIFSALENTLPRRRYRTPGPDSFSEDR